MSSRKQEEREPEYEKATTLAYYFYDKGYFTIGD